MLEINPRQTARDGQGHEGGVAKRRPKIAIYEAWLAVKPFLSLGNTSPDVPKRAFDRVVLAWLWFSRSLDLGFDSFLRGKGFGLSLLEDVFSRSEDRSQGVAKQPASKASRLAP